MGKYTDKRILIIDDEQSVRMNISSFLEDNNYITYTAEDGEKGLELVRELKPDLVITDLRMPGIDGLQLIKIIKEEMPDLPSIVISGAGLLNDAIEAIRRGAWDYISKPIYNMDEINIVVEKAFEKLQLINENIRYRDHLEREVEIKTDELRKTNKELEQMVYVTSHDLRSPLVNIDGFSTELDESLQQLNECLKKAEIPEEVKPEISEIMDTDIPEAIKFIHNGIHKMENLLSGLLLFSRSTRKELMIEKLDMNKLISIISNTIKFQLKDFKIDFICEDLPQCVGDFTQTSQVFSNLIDNAIKYRDTEKDAFIKISAKTEDNKVTYCVEDNGIGIEPAHQGKIFDIFHRLEPEMAEGHGLGMTIVKKIIDRENGEIRLESNPGIGSKFFVSLPAATE